MSEYKYDRVAYAITEKNGRSHWTRVGVSFVNKDGSETVLLDAAPLSGRLVLQDPKKVDDELEQNPS